MTRKLLSTIAALGLTIALVSAWRPAAAGQGAAPAPGGGAKPAQGSTGGGVVIAPKAKLLPGLRGEVQQQLDDAEKELIDLASVVPPDKFSWRPGPGVRSFGEVCLHVAGGNYEIGAAWGVQPPPGVDLKKIEEHGADKGNSVAAMRVSFEVIRQSIAAMPDAEVDKTIDFFGRPGTVRAALILAAVHAHEHLGQLIAYARVNGIVPPWTAAQQQREKQQQRKAPPAKSTGR
jgi:uncharacterized damage-inducible protein DinB